jgi:hypothetical protein
MIEKKWKFVWVMIAAIALFTLITIYQTTSISFENTPKRTAEMEYEVDLKQKELEHEVVQVEINSDELKSISKVRCPIYSFVKNMTKSNELAIQFWNRAWYNQGFAPYVLTEKDALSRPEYGMLMSKIPSSDLHSGYLRWLAMASVQGGLFVDVNIIPMQGHGKIFSRYSESCKPEGSLTVYENFGYKIFQGNSTSLHKFVHQLSREKNLKGKDEEWLIVNKSNYEISLSEEKIAALDVMNNAYFQKQRRFSHHLQFTPETLKMYLARVNFMNTHKIKILKHSDNMDNSSESAIENSIQRSLECPFPIPIGFDIKNVLPNENFTCQVAYSTGLASNSDSKYGENDNISDMLNEVCLVLIRNPKAHRNSSQKILSLFPFTNTEAHIQKIFQSNQYIVVLVDEDYRDVKTFLEFKFGFPIDIVPDYVFNDTAQREDQDQEISDDEESELYGVIKQCYTEEVTRIKEFV